MTTKTQVAEFIAECERCGFSIHAIGDSVVRITKSFTPGDSEAFSIADFQAPALLSMVPLKGGSVWGTDGGSVGGHSGLTRGRYELAKSGQTGKRFVQALRKVSLGLPLGDPARIVHVSE